MNKIPLLIIALLIVGGIGMAFSHLGGSGDQITAGIIAVDANSLFGGDGASDGTGAESEGSDTASQPEALAQATPKTTSVTQDMNGYENRDFRFGLLFPKNLRATEYKEEGGALSATFQDPNTNEGFQVYVTPYAKESIDTARFKLDEPSGVFKEPKEVVVGGVRGTMFYGKNGIMGDTREVWLIHGGYLYEVATYKELDSWLGGIMQTWKFL